MASPVVSLTCTFHFHGNDRHYNQSFTTKSNSFVIDAKIYPASPAGFFIINNLSRYHSYLNTAKKILDQYKGEQPFADFIKSFFDAEKKYGSKDRKQISHLCYCYFRLGKAAMNLPVEECILPGLFLCSSSPNEILKELRPAWNDRVTLPPEEKSLLLYDEFLITQVFPWAEELSASVNHREFCKSFFIQPDLFVRLRPGKEEAVKNKLRYAGIQFININETCLALPNTTKVSEVIELDNEAVIQDYNSQQTGIFLQPQTINHKLQAAVWDCCAGSGGKSILACDIIPNIQLTVSDIRQSILSNLEKRFQRAGIIKYKMVIADLSQPRSLFNIHHSPFDLIICDVPCTGSGTWSRTPEQLVYFDEKKINYYASLQKEIAANAIAHLKKDAYFLYCTCSVFKKENEEAVEFLKEKFNLQLVKAQLFKGYDKKADSIFAALFKRC